ncbi:MAG: hypothetical protein ACRD3C_19025 [Vicinamibacterales bacterium]
MTLLAWTTADPDLWGHVRFGLDALRDHALTTQDPYSFTSDRPWVNHEWLAEVIMGAAYSADGARGLVVLKLLVIALTVSLVLAALSHRVWDPISHDLLVGAAMFGILGRVHPVRPQVFSVLVCAALLLVLSLVDRGRRRLLALVPILMALWANLHGGYLVGLGIVGVWISARLYRPHPQGPPPRQLAVLGLSALAGTLATPYGMGLWLFLAETVGVTRTGISDWQPLWQAGPIVIAQWVVISATAALAFKRGQIDPAYMLIAGCLCLATLTISRFDAFYALAVTMLLGPYFGGRPVPAPAPIARRAATALATMGVLAVGVVVLANRSSCIQIRTGPEPEATRFASGLRGRMLTFFDWGEYGIWHLAPAIQVSMDGRRETVYSDSVIASHMRIYTNSPDAVGLVEGMHPDWIWFPRQWAVIARLQTAGWQVAFRGPVSVILSRQPGATTELQGTDDTPRCFPHY